MADVTVTMEDLGPCDAYAIAVSLGYTGTREEWLAANDIARTAVEAAQKATEEARDEALAALANFSAELYIEDENVLCTRLKGVDNGN